MWGCFNNSSLQSYRPLLRVGNEILDANTFSILLARKMKSYDAAAAKLPANVDRAKSEIIDEFILSSVVKSFADKNNIKVSDDEYEAAFNKIRMGFTSDLAFKSSLAESGLLFEEWKKEFVKSLLLKKVVEYVYAQASDKDSGLNEAAKKYFEEHQREFQHQAEIRLSQIVVKKSEEADKLHKIIKSGAYTFEAMAKKYSQSPDATKGGDIGFIAKGVVPAFDAAFNFGIGQMSSVIKSDYGYHLLKLTGRRPAAKLTFEQAKPEIMRLVTEHKKQDVFNQWFKNYVKGVKVEKNSSIIGGINVHTQGTRE